MVGELLVPSLVGQGRPCLGSPFDEVTNGRPLGTVSSETNQWEAVWWLLYVYVYVLLYVCIIDY